MKKILLIIGGIFLFLIIIGLAAGDPNKPEKIEELNIPTASPTPQPAQPDKYKIGDKVKLRDIAVTALGFEDFVSKDKQTPLKENHKLVSVDVMIENVGSKPREYSSYDFKLQDENKYSYEEWHGYFIPDAAKQPKLPSGNISPSQQIRGFITYEVPNTASNFTLIYTPGTLTYSGEPYGHEQIFIELF